MRPANRVPATTSPRFSLWSHSILHQAAHGRLIAYSKWLIANGLRQKLMTIRYSPILPSQIENESPNREIVTLMRPPPQLS